jgi:hypothetical protein
MMRAMRVRSIAVLLVAVVGVLALAASGSSKTSNTPVSTGSTTPGGSPAPAAVAHVGATIAVSGGGQKANVTLVQVIDPAKGAKDYMSPDAGKRFVGVKLTVQNTGSQTLKDDVNITASVKGADGQSYTPTFSDIAGCTNFTNGSYTLSPNESVTGCATFELPTGVAVKQVNYEPTSFEGTTTGQWLVP